MTEKIITHREPLGKTSPKKRSAGLPEISVPVRRFPRRLAVAGRFFRALALYFNDSAAGIAHSAARKVDAVKYSRRSEKARSVLPRSAGVMILAAIAIFMVASTLFGVGLNVYLDGEPVGFVSNQRDFDEIVSGIESKASKILGYPYTVHTDVEYKFELFRRDEKLDAQAIERALFSQIHEIDQLYVLTIDGEIVGATENKEAVERVLDTMLAQKLETEADPTATAEFTRNIDINLQYTSAQNAATITTLAGRLISNIRDESFYTVEEGDLFSDIAARSGMSAEALQAMNPGVDPSQILAGEKLVVGEAIPMMSIKIVKEETYEQEIPFETEYLTSSSMWKGESYIKQSGAVGTLSLTDRVETLNGKETGRENLITEVTLEPKNKIVVSGTRSFILPVVNYQMISSRFGWRSFNGRSDLHTGIDFAARTGTTVRASYGGTVEFSGWKGNYGYCVIINHGSGYKTLYAHNSKLLVSVGDKVAQGDSIARVGSTGRSTGSHCHFEIIINGTPVNPSKYLFK